MFCSEPFWVCTTLLLTLVASLGPVAVLTDYTLVMSARGVSATLVSKAHLTFCRRCAPLVYHTSETMSDTDSQDGYSMWSRPFNFNGTAVRVEEGWGVGIGTLACTFG